jgi:hypothetical protein
MRPERMTRAGPGGCCTRLSRKPGVVDEEKKRYNCWLPMYVLLWPALPALYIMDDPVFFSSPLEASGWLV